MITKKQLKILNVLRKSQSINFSELKRQLKESSSSYLQKTMSDFKKENIVIIRKVGRTNLIFCNYENNKLFDYLSIIDLDRIDKKIYEVIYNLQKNLLKETEFFSLIVFGSYAEGRTTKKSDLDLAIIIGNTGVGKKMIPRIDSVKRKELVDMDVHVFTRKEFLEMLKDEKENVGKEIVRKHLVVYGLANFYNLILKEMKNVAFS